MTTLPPSLSESCFETIDFRTIVKDGKNIHYIHKDESSLIYALKYGEKHLILPSFGEPCPDDLAIQSASHTLS